MSKLAAIAILLSSLVRVGCSQDAAPALLQDAAHCLVAKGFLPTTKAAATTLSLGFFLDTASYAPDTALYVVNYRAQHHADGWVFVLFTDMHAGVRHFNIQNNARFVLATRESDGVDFVDPPLGGEWTQHHLAAAIKRIEHQRRYTVPVAVLSAAVRQLTCRSYTDPRPPSVQEP
jgi:hypothetical protein